MQQYLWAIRVTMEFLDGDGGVEDKEIKVRECSSEKEARARHQAIVDTVARTKESGNHPKYQRLGGSELLRRPVGDWETVA